MNPETLLTERAAARRTGARVLRDYGELVRPRIVGLVLFTLAVAAVVSGPAAPPWTAVVHAVAGNALVIAGAIAMNQRRERSTDARMARTARRPLPSGRLSAREAGLFAAVTSAVGLAYLAAAFPWPMAALAAASWALYVWVYTPLKTTTAWQTPVGAAAGAMPALLGGAAAGDWTSPTALALFGVVYLWQFPHAMAVAWLYRRECAAAELRLVTVADPTGKTAGRWAVAGAAALAPVSLVPWWAGRAGEGYGILALLLGAGYLGASIAFWRRPDDAAARRLLAASVAYLPLLLAALLAAALL